MSSLETLSAEEVSKAVQAAIKGLNQIKEVNDVVIVNTLYEIDEGLDVTLEEGRITRKQYNEMLEQNKAELAFRYEGKKDIEQQLKRMEALKAPQDEPKGFIIPETTTREEFKKLIALMETKKSLTESSEEKLLLSVLLQTAAACKNSLDEKKTFEKKSIPLLKSEEQYVTSLLSQMENSEIHDNYQKKGKLEKITKECMVDPTLSSDERRILQSLCDNISREVQGAINALITSGEAGDDKYLDKVEEHLRHSLEESEEIAITFGFKGFINEICTTFKLDPIFTISNSPIIEKMKDIKSNLFSIKEEATEFTEDDEKASLLGKGT
ncbi:hypothetical protein [Legionella maioricensis]|uniref:Coiled coil protein n=1 Tax=Legionella maioricensis TaxID=2896528 RepID=A0A9X2D2H5_9GAMM|nr:hypothetical protein [Legionella maioricensis]MCL9685052.1 hypothetical protein [Legionella maioricensis]MCL9688187.1 hypothetical protein [Legionella maioricensis]